MTETLQGTLLEPYCHKEDLLEETSRKSDEETPWLEIVNTTKLGKKVLGKTKK